MHIRKPCHITYFESTVDTRRHNPPSGWYENGWYERHLDEEGLDCTVDQMKKAASGHLTTEAIMWNQDDNTMSASGMVRVVTSFQTGHCVNPLYPTVFI